MRNLTKCEIKNRRVLVEVGDLIPVHEDYMDLTYQNMIVVEKHSKGLVCDDGSGFEVHVEFRISESGDTDEEVAYFERIKS